MARQTYEIDDVTFFVSNPDQTIVSIVPSDQDESVCVNFSTLAKLVDRMRADKWSER